jgi:hypothetical protein
MPCSTRTPIGRIFKQQMAAGPKWVWFLQVAPVPPPNESVADTLDEARAALAKRYQEVNAENDGTALSAEQRRALAMLATAGRNGATQPLLTRNMRQ